MVFSIRMIWVWWNFKTTLITVRKGFWINFVYIRNVSIAALNWSNCKRWCYQVSRKQCGGGGRSRIAHPIENAGSVWRLVGYWDKKTDRTIRPLSIETGISRTIQCIGLSTKTCTHSLPHPTPTALISIRSTTRYGAPFKNVFTKLA